MTSAEESQVCNPHGISTGVGIQHLMLCCSQENIPPPRNPSISTSTSSSLRHMSIVSIFRLVLEGHLALEDHLHRSL